MADFENERREAERRYQELYPHPSRGVHASEARGRVAANPAVMPPRSRSAEEGAWTSNEIMGMRALPLAILVGAGVLLPFFLRFTLSRRRQERDAWKAKAMKAEKRAMKLQKASRASTASKVAKAKKVAGPALVAAKGMKKMKDRRDERAHASENHEPQPRFFILASRPYGKSGKRERALFAGKVEG